MLMFQRGLDNGSNTTSWHQEEHSNIVDAAIAPTVSPTFPAHSDLLLTAQHK